MSVRRDWQKKPIAFLLPSILVVVTACLSEPTHQVETTSVTIEPRPVIEVKATPSGSGVVENLDKTPTVTVTQARSTQTTILQTSTPAPSITPIPSFTNILEKVKPAVVRIVSDGKSVGSGMIIDPKGYVLTNSHVVENLRNLTVFLSDGSRYPAQVIGLNIERDVALLGIQGGDLATVRLGSTSPILEGEEVVALGYAFHLPGSVTMTKGIVSAFRSGYIQTDAAINPGNSGGPLVDMEGRVVGMVTLKIRNELGGADAEGLAFAIPTSTLDPTSKLLRTGLYGPTPTPQASPTSPSPITAKDARDAVRAYMGGLAINIQAEAIRELYLWLITIPPSELEIPRGSASVLSPDSGRGVQWVVPTVGLFRFEDGKLGTFLATWDVCVIGSEVLVMPEQMEMSKCKTGGQLSSLGNQARLLEQELINPSSASLDFVNWLRWLDTICDVIDDDTKINQDFNSFMASPTSTFTAEGIARMREFQDRRISLTSQLLSLPIPRDSRPIRDKFVEYFTILGTAIDRFLELDSRYLESFTKAELLRTQAFELLIDAVEMKSARLIGIDEEHRKAYSCAS